MNPPPFDIFRDQTAVTLAATVPLMVVVPSSPASSSTRANPGRLNHSPSGVATQRHLAAEPLVARGPAPG